MKIECPTCRNHDYGLVLMDDGYWTCEICGCHEPHVIILTPRGGNMWKVRLDDDYLGDIEYGCEMPDWDEEEADRLLREQFHHDLPGRFILCVNA